MRVLQKFFLEEEIYMIEFFYILLFLLSAAQFGFSGYYFYESKKRLNAISKSSTNQLSSFVKINTQLISKDYSFEDVVNAVNELISSLNKTNKGSYIATAIVTIFSGVVTLISGFILYFNF